MLEHLRVLEVFMRRKRGVEGCWESFAERLFWSCGRNESSIYNHLVARNVMKAEGGKLALSSQRQDNLIRVCRDLSPAFSSEMFGKTSFSCFLRERFRFSSSQILALPARCVSQLMTPARVSLSSVWPANFYSRRSVGLKLRGLRLCLPRPHVTPFPPQLFASERNHSSLSRPLHLIRHHTLSPFFLTFPLSHFTSLTSHSSPPVSIFVHAVQNQLDRMLSIPTETSH